eukprot:3817555-Prymnesium_polylepis.1
MTLADVVKHAAKRKVIYVSDSEASDGEVVVVMRRSRRPRAGADGAMAEADGDPRAGGEERP